MGHRSQTAARLRVGDPHGRDAQNRVRIAQVAARLIAEHGIADWTLAKRKAVRELMLPEREALPRDDEIELALIGYHALFGGNAHAVMLRERREEALRWMRRLSQFLPLLTGGVAAGWATVHSDICLELVAVDAKIVELALLNASVSYRTMQADRDGAAELFVDTAHGGLRLSISATAAARQRPRRDRHGNDELRLNEAAVIELLGNR